MSTRLIIFVYTVCFALVTLRVIEKKLKDTTSFFFLYNML